MNEENLKKKINNNHNKIAYTRDLCNLICKGLQILNFSLLFFLLKIKGLIECCQHERFKTNTSSI